MCTVSMIGDGWREQFPERHPWYPINPATPIPNATPTINWPPLSVGPTREEFEALKKEVEELKKLLAAAQKFDEATGQPHCEQDEKVEFIKKIAEFVGVDLKDVLK